MNNAFTLHPQLAADTTLVTDGPLSHVLLMNDARYPWLILVPKRPDLVDYDDLSTEDRVTLGNEAAAVSKVIKRRFEAHKTNVAMLGNMVPQLIAMWSVVSRMIRLGRVRFGVLVPLNPMKKMPGAIVWPPCVPI